MANLTALKCTDALSLQRDVSQPTVLRDFMALLLNIVAREWISITVTTCARQIWQSVTR